MPHDLGSAYGTMRLKSTTLAFQARGDGTKENGSWDFGKTGYVQSDNSTHNNKTRSNRHVSPMICTVLR